MAMHLSRKTAGKTFRAKCGCMIKKGSPYLVYQDHSMAHSLYESFCTSCWDKQSGVKTQEGDTE